MNINETVNEVIDIDEPRNSEQPRFAAHATLRWAAAYSGRSRPIAASHPQPDSQCYRSHEWGRRGSRELLVSTAADDSDAVLVAIRDIGPGLDRAKSTTSSTPSIRPSVTAWAWVWQSAAQSSRLTAGAFGRNRTRRVARFFSSPCLWARRRHYERRKTIVFVIDDDPSICAALSRLFRAVVLNVQTFGSTQNFSSTERPDAPGCIVLDIKLPGLNGLDFQSELVKSSTHLPIIFITGYGDIPMSVRAIKAGAIEFLTKPFRERDLLEAVRQGNRT